MRTPVVAEQHSGCEHVALIHRGLDDLVRRLSPSLHRAAEEAAPVLICLDAPSEAALRSEVGSICDSFEFRPSDARYATPGAAMADLHAFMASALQSGAPAAWSIGAIPLGRDGRDDRWIRYEEAVLALFADQPLRAVCLYDAETTPRAVRDDVLRTHQAADGEWHAETHEHDGAAADVDAEVPPVHPARAADLVVHDFTPRGVRLAVAANLAERMTAASLADLQLVCSELATNAISHGEPPIALRVWREPSRCIVQVTDCGSSSIDPHADLRPCAGGAHGGFGLWTVGQIADSVNIARTAHGNDVTVSVPLR